jgi:hypothetical protein
MPIKNCKHCGDRFVADESWKTVCVPCYIKMKKAAEPPPEPETVYIRISETIPDDMLMRIIRLCHPDRHQNSEASTIATKWLLDVRTKQAGK